MPASWQACWHACSSHLRNNGFDFELSQIVQNGELVDHPDLSDFGLSEGFSRMGQPGVKFEPRCLFCESAAGNERWGNK